MKELGIRGKLIHISEDLADYNLARRDFYIRSLNSQKEFEKYYRETIHTTEDLLEKAPLLAATVIDCMVDYAIGLLVKAGIMTCSKSVFIDRYFREYFDYGEYFQPVVERFMEIAYTKQEMDQYRDMKANGHGYWMGGGFGLKGAVAGAVMAGTLNFGSDLIRSIGSGFARVGDQRKINKMKEMILKDPDTFSDLSFGVMISCFNVFYGFITEIENFSNGETISFDTDQPNAIFENVQSYITDPNQIVGYMVDCINMYPYNINYYYYLVDALGDEDGEILRVADYFGFGEEIKTYQDNAKKKMMHEALNLQENSIPDMIQKRNTIKKKAMELGLEYQDELNRLDQKIENAKKQREEKKKVVNKFEEIQRIKADMELMIKTDKTIQMQELIEEGNPYAEQTLVNYYTKSNQISRNRVYDLFKYSDDSFGLCILGQLYNNGEGVPKDQEKARALLIESMELGSNYSRFLVGFNMYKGQMGFVKDQKQGTELIKASSNTGLPTAQAWLGSFYRTGTTYIDQNRELAKALLTHAAAYGQVYAINELKKL
jgi:hypothetical protein